MEHWRTARISERCQPRGTLRCRNPFAGSRFRVAVDVSALFRRTGNEEEPGIKTPRAECGVTQRPAKSEIAGSNEDRML